jgi:mannose/cellobiose epimerase-like protein (N-acyl-D-glucosamine 2-epimerase family)
MKRRNFLGLSAAAAAGGLTFGGCRIEKNKPAPKTQYFNDTTKLAGLTLDELKKQYQSDLFDDFLPFLEKYVIDHEYGGFMCTTDRDGTTITKDKNTWYEGRGIWVYSFLYNKIKQDPKYLEVARKSVEFILKRKPSKEPFWPVGYTRYGKTLKGKVKGDIYGNLFIANGLAEYSKAPGNESYWDMAKNILLDCMKLYDSPGYKYSVTYLRDKPPKIKAPRVLGHWMVILNLVTQMLETRSDREIEGLALRAVDAIMNYHFNPDYGLINEVVNHDLSRTKDDYAQFAYTGHAIETLWMVLYEAARLKDKQLFDTAAERFHRHLEIAWDDIYGGAFRSLDNVDKNIWKVDKVLWLQEEVLIGTLFIVEHTSMWWARDWFSKMYKYVHETFPLKKYGFALWDLGGDRKVTIKPHASRVENFHHPRHLMLNLLSLDRMISRNCEVSDLF